MSQVLLTGGAGFIGSNLARALLEQGARVRVLDNFSTGREQNLADIAARIDLVRADLTDRTAVAGAAKGCEYVFHQAALPSVPRSIADPIGTHEANATGTLNVLEGARAAGVKRVVYAASSSAYGDAARLPKVETMRPDPPSPYAVSKLAGEFYLRAYFLCYGMPTVGLRYFNVFGPRQDPQSQYAAVIPRFITAALEDRRPTIYGDGTQSRDFCYIDNVVEANLKAARSAEAPGRVFNVACGVRITLLDVIDRLARMLGKRAEPQFEPARPGDIKDSLADITAAREVLGYTASVSFDEGLARTVDWFRR
jgi:UDP-glucose 4-epimerase